jgi:hypothetical protein
MSYYVNWIQNGIVLTGKSEGTWTNNPLVFPINYPGNSTLSSEVVLHSSSFVNTQNYNLKNVSFYLTGSDSLAIQTIWPYIGDTYTPTRPELNGGFEISFDGNTWIRFNSGIGLQTNRSTWLTLSSLSTGNGIDGLLGPLDTATLMLRYVVPSNITLYKVLDVNLAISFEVE